MMKISTQIAPRRLRPLILGSLLAGVVALLSPMGATAAVTSIGSPLSAPATLNTAENLGYPGINTAVPPSPQYPSGVVHTFHFGADTAVWNTSVAGQAVRLSLEGCAEPAPGGPPPLTQIHFQDLSPLPGGGARVNLSSQPFNIPVCGRGGARPDHWTPHRGRQAISQLRPDPSFELRGPWVRGRIEMPALERSVRSTGTSKRL